MTKRALLSLLVLLVAACFCLSMVLIFFALANVIGSHSSPASFQGQPLQASLHIMTTCLSSSVFASVFASILASALVSSYAV